MRKLITNLSCCLYLMCWFIVTWSWTYVRGDVYQKMHVIVTNTHFSLNCKLISFNHEVYWSLTWLQRVYGWSLTMFTSWIINVAIPFKKFIKCEICIILFIILHLHYMAISWCLIEWYCLCVLLCFENWKWCWNQIIVVLLNGMILFFSM